MTGAMVGLNTVPGCGSRQPFFCGRTNNEGPEEKVRRSPHFICPTTTEARLSYTVEIHWNLDN